MLYLLQAQVVEYVCSKQNVFSSKIKKCCEKAAIDKGQCVVEAGRDEKPEDLPLIAGKYVQDPDVCNHFVAGHDKFLAEYVMHVLVFHVTWCMYTNSQTGIQ